MFRRVWRRSIIWTRRGARAISSSAKAGFCGRAISNKEVEIYRYVTEGSFDAYMWQTLETKARFIQQVMSGETSVRTAEDLEGGALTYAEIKAIASGNPAVMEKVKIDTEIRKLDQLRAAHLNQQHNIRWQIRNLPEQIAEADKTLASVREDIATRDAHEGGEFSMIVGTKEFSGKGAREEAAKALDLRCADVAGRCHAFSRVLHSGALKF